MRESIGYTVTLNIVIIFIVIIFSFLSFSLIYYKANKATNVVVSEIEKYEGYNILAENNILERLYGLGYNTKSINCGTIKDRSCTSLSNLSMFNEMLDDETKDKILNNIEYYNGEKGYCVYLCYSSDDYYYYKIKTNMFLNIPIINDILNIPIFSNTKLMYNFEKNQFRSDEP